MVAEISKLVIEVDSSKVKSLNSELNRLNATSKKTESSTKKNKKAHDDNAKSTSKSTQEIKAQNAALSQSSKTVNLNNQQLQNMSFQVNDLFSDTGPGHRRLGRAGNIPAQRALRRL